MAQKNNSISLANVIATIGLVLITVFIFLGCFYSGDNIGISILKAVGWALLFTFLLWFLIKAKSADDDLKKWLVIEILTLVVYLIAAGISSPKVARFATVYMASSDLKATANSDIEKIRQGIDLFKTTEHRALSVTITGLENATNGEVSEELSDFVATNNFELNPQSINIFKEKWEAVIDNVTDSTLSSFSDVWDAELTRCNDLIQGWSVLKIPEAISTMTTIGEQVSAKLAEVSSTLPLPKIYRNDNGIYDIEEQHTTFNNAIDARFGQEINALGNFSIVGILVCLILHAMILFNYLVAYRSKKKRPQKSDMLFNDHGMTLKY